MKRLFLLCAPIAIGLIALLAPCLAVPAVPAVPAFATPTAAPKHGATHHVPPHQKIHKTMNEVSPATIKELHAPDASGRTGMDLVSLKEIVPSILIDSPLARKDNAFHYQFFKENTAYIRYATAKKIAAVERTLEKQGYRLKIWAAYRPMPVQIKMYELAGRNGDWVSDPYETKSKKAHVRAVAIDCTLVDRSGKELAMPTGYLDFKNYKKMWADCMDLPPAVIKNRAILHDAMLDHGMSGYSKEWWHFQDNRIMAFPALTMQDYPELYKEILVDELLALEPGPIPTVPQP